MSVMESTSKIEEANKELVREFMRTVFDDHRPDRAVEFFAPQGKWHGGNFGTVEGAQNIAGLLSARRSLQLVVFIARSTTDGTSDAVRTKHGDTPAAL